MLLGSLVAGGRRRRSRGCCARRLGWVTAGADRRVLPGRWSCIATGDADPGQRRARRRAGRGPPDTCSLGHRRPGARGLLDLRRRPAAAQHRLLFVPGRGPAGVLAVARWRAGAGCSAPLGSPRWRLSRWPSSRPSSQLARIDRACDVTDVIDNVTGAAIGVAARRRAAPWCCGRGGGRPPTPPLTGSPCPRPLSGAMTPLSRAPTSRAIPPYVAGQAADAPRRADVVQALLQREPLPAAARRGRGRDARRPRR